MSKSLRITGAPVVLAVICAALVAASFAGSVSADPGDIVVTLFNCTGPAGTPATFTIEKKSPSAAAEHIVGTNEIFNRQGEYDLTLAVAVYGPPAGLASSGLMVTCETISPLNGHDVLLYGKIAQTSP